MQNVTQYDDRVTAVTISLRAEQTESGAAHDLTATDEHSRHTYETFGTLVRRQIVGVADRCSINSTEETQFESRIEGCDA